MIKNSGNNGGKIVPCRLSWLLVEVKDDSRSEYFVIHSVEVIGDINKAYVKTRVRFNQERRELIGIVRLASDDLKVVEAERNRLRAKDNLLLIELDPQKANLLCLVRQTTDETKKVQLLVVNCKTLTSTEVAESKRKHFIMEKGNLKIPVVLLHISENEQQLLDMMEFFKTSVTNTCLSDEKDGMAAEVEGIEEPFLLIQYFESRTNMVYKIIQYKDTIYKKENLFKNVVVYIPTCDNRAISQGMILRKSYVKDKLTKLIFGIREACDKLDFRMIDTSYLDRA